MKPCKSYPSYRVLQLLLIMFAVLVYLVQLPRVRAAASPGGPGWSFTPTAGLYLALVMNRPAIGDAGHLLVTEVLYDPDAQSGEVEWIEVFNPTGDVLDLGDFKLGDEETLGGSEGMLQFPAGASLGVGRTAVIAADASAFQQRYGFAPDFEFKDSGSPVPDMLRYTAWAGGNVLLTNTGDEVLLLDLYDDLVDAVSWDSSTWAFNPSVPGVAKGHSIERLPAYVDTDSAADWAEQGVPTPGWVDLLPPTPTPTPGPTATPFAGGLLISEVQYDPLGPEPGAEWVELYNWTSVVIDISGFKLGDEETAGGTEGMYAFPAGSQVAPGQALVVAHDAAVFKSVYGWAPDYEVVSADPSVPDLVKYGVWGNGSMSLSNTGDEVLLLDGLDSLVDAVSWGNSTWAFDPPVPGVNAGSSVERYPPDTDTNTAADWREQPAPGPGTVPAQAGTPEP